MFRVNSTSKQLVRLNVIESGRSQVVELLPKNFVFTEVVTSQMKLMEKEGVIKVREAKIVKAATQTTTADMAGKLDFNNSGVAKVQKKKN